MLVKAVANENCLPLKIWHYSLKKNDGLKPNLSNAPQGEFVQKATVAEYATVQIEGAREVNRTIEHYNL